MRISTVGPLLPAPHDYMPHAKAFGNNNTSKCMYLPYHAGCILTEWYYKLCKYETNRMTLENLL